jgi:hypothetical protein
MNAFQLRLELLKMAKEMLVEDYYTRKEHITNDWSTKVDAARQSGTVPPEHPSMPDYPSESQIIEKAAALNGFVSQTTPAPEVKITRKSNS